MKIICDNCRTKYSIADEKVKGKVFKIRCKKCQNIIVVHGNKAESEGQQPDAPAAEQDEGKETPVWHLVIGRDQVGPMTVEEVRDRFAKGEIDAETYIWREGFSDWLRLTTIDDFADLDQATKVAPTDAADFGAPTQEPEWPGDAGGSDGDAPRDWGGAGGDAGAWGGTQPQPGEMGASQDTHRSDPASLEPQEQAADAGLDLFASQTDGATAPAEGNVGEMAAAQAPAPAPEPEAGLFQAPADSPDPSMLKAPSEGGQQLFPADDDQDSIQMKGARHENSVLFSLSNLQALAMGGKPAAAAPVAASSGSPAASGAEEPGTDGSGLIDIRSMASTPAPAGMGPSAPAGADSLPDLGGYASPIAAAPVLMPTASEERPKWLIPTIAGVGGTLIVTVIVLVVFLVVRKPETTIVAAKTPTASQQAANTAAPKAPEKGTSADDVAKKSAESDPEAKAEEKKPTAVAAKAKRRKSKARRARKSSRATTPRAAAPERRSRRRSTKPKRKGDELDRLIDGAIDGKQPRARTRKRPTAAAPDPNLPKSLGRSDIQRGMQRIKGRVQACYDKFRVPGMATAKVTIGRKGRLTAAVIKGRFAATPTGACVRSAVMSAKFPKFSGSPIKIQYPFVLR